MARLPDKLKTEASALAMTRSSGGNPIPMGGAPASALPRACLICTTPRSGSYLLSEALESTGYLGRPNEYFRGTDDDGKWWSERLGVERPADYVDKVVAQGSTPNGVFGLKLQWFQVADLINRFRSVYGDLSPGADVDQCLRRRFARVDYFWLRRRNKVAQGISWYRAIGSGVWFVPSGTAAEATPDSKGVKFDFAEIDRRIRLIEDYDRWWHEFFIGKKMRVLVLVYEDFVRSQETYERTIQEICKYAGFAPHGVPVRAPAYRPQADALSLQWEQQYRQIKAGLYRAAGPPTKDRPQGQVTVMRDRPQPQRAADPPPLPAPSARTRPAPTAPAQTASAKSESSSPELPLVAYDLKSQLGVRIVTAPLRRDWMDASRERFAYSCLPLVIANQHGWLLLCPCRLEAVWNGTAPLDAIAIAYPPNETRRFASSHFGEGILTFHMDFIFRTPPGVNLHVRGPANMPKDGIQALEGIIETDWSEATFTMNWKMTRAHHPVIFEENEPFAMLTPVVRGEIERYRPEIRPVSDNPELEAGFRAWSRSRDAFNEGLKVSGSDARKMRRERHYVRGQTVMQRRALEHQTGLDLQEFVDKRSEGFELPRQKGAIDAATATELPRPRGRIDPATNTELTEWLESIGVQGKEEAPVVRAFMNRGKLGSKLRERLMERLLRDGEEELLERMRGEDGDFVTLSPGK